MNTNGHEWKLGDLATLMLALVSISAWIVGCQYPAGLGRYHVTRVIDGDTVVVKSATRVATVRLAGIDAPELHQPWGPESREALAGDVLWKDVEIDCQAPDRYGRVVGRIVCEGEDVCLKQVETGNAWHYVEYARTNAALRAAQTEAQKASRGLWGLTNALVAPWTYRKEQKALR